MITKLDAILSLRPLAEFTLRGDELDWLDSKQTEPVQSEIDAEVARLQADHDSKAYATARADAYASIGDQLDMQYHDSVNGSRTWLDHIEAVKEAHPK